MTITITTTYTSNASGKGIVVAKGHGKQRTVPYDHSASPAVNHAAACGTLANVLLDPEQQAKVRHASGKQRVHHFIGDKGRVTRDRWTIDV